MLNRYVSIKVSIIIVMMPILMSCSKQGRDLALCWLRPSCIPQAYSSTTSKTTNKSKPSSKSPPKTSRWASSSVTCQPSVRTTLTANNASITLSYTEPKVNAMGEPLTNLSKTTIYYNLGAGFVKAKEKTATSPQGGGKIVESIQIPVQSKQPVEATICVVAINTKGLASFKIAKARVSTLRTPPVSPKPQEKRVPPQKAKISKRPTPSPQLIRCHSSAKTTVSATKTSLNISYREPSTRADGSPLTNLAKTTIYYDVGTGFVKAKEKTATSPQGGGKVVESIQIPVQSEQPVEATICVTATNTQGIRD